MLRDSGPAALDHFQLTLPVRGDTGRIRQPSLNIQTSGPLYDPLLGCCLAACARRPSWLSCSTSCQS